MMKFIAYNFVLAWNTKVNVTLIAHLGLDSLYAWLRIHGGKQNKMSGETKSLGEVAFIEFCRQFGFTAKWDKQSPKTVVAFEMIATRVLEECGG